MRIVVSEPFCSPLINAHMIKNLDQYWRSVVTPRCGGETFDKPGSGYSFSDVLAAERQLALSNVLDDPSSALCKLSVADPTWKMPLDAMLAGMDYYNSSPDATRYTDNNGIPGTHEAIAEFLNTMHPGSGVKFDKSWVQYSPGSIKRALAEFMPATFFDKDTLLFFPDPSYAVVKSDINKRGAVIGTIPLVLSGGRYYIDYDKMNTVMKVVGVKKRVLYLNVPHNPTGTTFSRTDWENLIKWATENNVIVIVDEAYTHLRYSNGISVLDVAGWEQCCVVLQSISKGWNATGARFGYIVAHPTVISVVRKVTDVKDSGGFGPTIASALWCLKHPEFAAGTGNAYRALHTELKAGLDEAGFSASMPEAGLCQLTKAPKAADGVVFTDATHCSIWLREHKRISVMPVTIANQAWLRWAVTIAPVKESGLITEQSVISEVVRRLKDTKLEF